jgi:hypothetical protein
MQTPLHYPGMNVLSMARVMLKNRKKKGKRGRKACAMYAIIIAYRMEGITFKVIADRLNIKEGRNVSSENVKHYYRIAIKELARIASS